MLVIITGKMCSGKDTVVKRLINKGFKKVVTYTTRPMRRGETDGVDYHFISEEEFKKRIQNGFFLEYRTRKITSGDTWYYGSAKQDVMNIRDDQKKVIILSPSGVDKMYELKRTNDILFKIVHLKCTDATIRERAKHRRDDKQDVENRIISEGNDFCVMDIFADKIVWNNLDCELGDVVKEVLDYIEGEM